MKSFGLIAVSSIFFIAGCQAIREPQNIENVNEAEAYQAQYRNDIKFLDQRDIKNPSSFLNMNKCKKTTAPPWIGKTPGHIKQVMSPGDLLTVHVEEDETFTGRYVVSGDGYLHLPFMTALSAKGRTPESLENTIAKELVKAEFYDEKPRVSVRMNDFAEAKVFVSGAVFEPTAVIVGGKNSETRDTLRAEAIGAATFTRNLSRALASAGGVRPDADLSKIVIQRGGTTFSVDARPAINGQRFNDIQLIEGDQINVASRECFQEDLMVPNSITPPGVTVFFSNLTQPAASNASSNNGIETRQVRYGTRFIQAAFGMNCVGGSKLTNANRRVALFSRNPITKESVVIERKFEQLLRRADRDEFDPYLLPGDAMACYDSNTVDITDVARSLGVIGVITFLR
jgi:protein involved in polysaccharide export with SLBB domain